MHIRKLVVAVLCLSTLICGAGNMKNYAYPESIANWTAQEKASQLKRGTELLAKIVAAVPKKNQIIVLDKDTNYRISRKIARSGDTALSLNKADGLTIDGNGSTIWLEDFISFLYMKDCVNVTIKNLKIDYDPLPWIQGTITKIIDKRHVELQIHQGFEAGIEGLKKINGLSNGAINISNSQTLRLRDESQLYWLRKFGKLSDTGVVTLEIAPQIVPGTVSEGDYLSIIIRMGTVISQYRCSHSKFENLTIYTSPGLCVYERYNLASTLYQNIRMVKRPETMRLFSATADGIHANASKSGIIVKDCTFDSLGDDGVNFHGFYSLVTEKLGPRKYRLAPLLLRNFEKGNKISCYSLPKMQKIGSFKVVDYKTSTDPELLKQARNSRHEANKVYPEARLMNMASLEVIDVELDSDIDLPRFTVVEGDDYICAGSQVTGCSFTNLRGRGVMISSNNFLIKDCTFEWLSGPAIEMALDLPWISGPGSHHGIIEDNKVNDVAISLDSREHYKTAVAAIASHVYVPSKLTNMKMHSDIIIRNNSIRNSGLAAISLLNCDGGAITGNTIINPNCRPPHKLGEKLGIDCRYGIITGGSENIKISGNKIELKSANSKGKYKNY